MAAALTMLMLALTYRTTLGLVASAIGGMLMATSIVMQIRHRWGPPCTECVKAMPLNPGGSAREDLGARWALKAFHTVVCPLPMFLLGSTAHFVLIALGCRPLYELVGMEDAQNMANIFLGLGLGFTAITNWMTRTHNRLSPWCPYCEDDEPAPADPDGGRNRPVAT
ncbi:hypothetical protein [Streptomyces sp. NPDC054865]